MSSDTKAMIELFDQLPEDKRVEVADFARFLLARSQGEEDGDARWEAIVNDPRPRPKLDAYVKAALEEGGLEPLDPDRL
jgi:hypothetical protein